jgi:hypothetical protein
MNWHGFGMYGMFGGLADPGEANFTQRVAAEIPGINTHGSPYRDYQTPELAWEIDQLPAEDGVFVWGTSLGACDVPIVCTYAKHTIAGGFGFQASVWGAHMVLPANLQFAHLIMSYNPIPVPGIGCGHWTPGPGFDPARLHITVKNLIHPGDYDLPSQMMFISEMKRIVAS